MPVQIVPTNAGFPVQLVSQLLIRIGSFDTDATSTQLYFDAQTSGGTSVVQGNIPLPEINFTGFTNATNGTGTTYVENYALSYLGVTRL